MWPSHPPRRSSAGCCGTSPGAGWVSEAVTVSARPERHIRSNVWNGPTVVPVRRFHSRQAASARAASGGVPVGTNLVHVAAWPWVLGELKLWWLALSAAASMDTAAIVGVERLDRPTSQADQFGWSAGAGDVSEGALSSIGSRREGLLECSSASESPRR